MKATESRMWTHEIVKFFQHNTDRLMCICPRLCDDTTAEYTMNGALNRMFCLLLFAFSEFSFESKKKNGVRKLQ